MPTQCPAPTTPRIVMAYNWVCQCTQLGPRRKEGNKTCGRKTGQRTMVGGSPDFNALVGFGGTNPSQVSDAYKKPRIHASFSRGGHQLGFTLLYGTAKALFHTPFPRKGINRGEKFAWRPSKKTYVKIYENMWCAYFPLVSIRILVPV